MNVLRGIFIFTALIILSITTASASWANESYTNAKNITLLGADTELTNCPYLVSVVKESTMQSDYDDLIFYDQPVWAGGNIINFEIETYNSTIVTVWLNITSLPIAGKTMSVYYGNSTVSSTENSNATWNGDYVGVWHMSDNLSTYTWNDYKYPEGVLTPNSTDGYMIAEVSVLHEDSKFKMWCNHRTTGYGTDALRYHTSPNGVNWSDASGVLIDDVHSTYLYKNGDEYWMYAAIHNASCARCQTNLWISDNETNFTLAEDPCWTGTDLGGGQVGNHHIWKENVSDWYGIFEYYSSGWLSKYGTSSNGKDWTFHNQIVVSGFGSSSCSGAWVTKNNGTYYMWFHGNKGDAGGIPSDIYVAKSTNRQDWTYIPGHELTREYEWEGYGLSGGQCGDPDLVEDNGSTYIYYTGRKTQAEPNIRLGLSKLPTSLQETIGLIEGDSNAVTDSTSNGRDGTPSDGVSSSSVNSIIGSSMLFSSNWIDLGTPPAYSDSTHEIWFNASTIDGTNRDFYDYNIHSPAGTPDILFRAVDEGGVDKLRAMAGGWFDYVSSSPNQWHQAVIISNSSGNDLLIVNGVQVASKVHATAHSGDVTVWIIANGRGKISTFQGALDECRVSDIVRSTDWVNLSYQMVINSSYVTFGAEESAPSAEPIITLLSQTPSIIYTNSTGYLNISYGISHGASGLNNTSVSFVYRNYDYDLSDSNHSIRPPANDLASVWNFNGRILRGANRNETPGLNFENNDTITGGDTYTWSGLDENSTKLTIVPVNNTYTKVYINATVHCIMPQMWYLDRTDQQQATKTQLPIHKTSNVLIKFWNFEIYKGNYDFLGVGYTDTLLSSNPALWPSDANPVNFYYVNSSYDPATGGDPITSGYAVYMGSLNASGWTDHVYSRSDSNYVRGFIDNNYLHTIINTTNISYLYFSSNTESSKPYYINMTNVASSTNVSFADTNTLWAGNTPPYTPQAYTPNVWFAFMKLNMSLDHKLYAADNNDLWGSSTMNRTNITQALFPPTTPAIDHFHFLGEIDYDMDGVYYGNFSIGCGVSTDPDGGDVTHNLTLHYANNLTFVTIINNTFTDKDITHNGVYFDANFSSSPYYSDDVNYTLRLIATDDESESVTVWLGVNFTLSITPIITSYTPSTPVTTIQRDTQEFTINISQIVNVTWYIDGSVVSTVNDTNYSTYSNNTTPIGTYNVTAHVENINGTRQQVWDWEVEDPVFAALLQLQADIDKMKKTQTIIQALIFLVIGVVVGVVAQRRRFNDEDSEKPIESKNN